MGRAAPTKLRGPYLPWVCLSNSSPRSFLSLWLEEGLDLQAGFRDNLKCVFPALGVCVLPLAPPVASLHVWGGDLQQCLRAKGSGGMPIFVAEEG